MKQPRLIRNFFKGSYFQRVKDEVHLKLFLFLIFGIGIVTLSLAFFSLSIYKPYMGITISYYSTGWEVSSLDRNGLAAEIGINIKDVPLEINNQPAETFLVKYENVGVLYGPLIKELKVVNSGNTLKSAILKNGSPRWQSIIETSSAIITSFIFWVIGLYAFSKKPKNISAIILGLSGLCFGLAISGNMAFDRSISVAIFFAVASATLGPWLLLHFFIVLPEERAWSHNNPYIYLIYLPAIVILIFFPIIGFADGQPVPWFRSIRIIGYGIGFLTAAIVALINYLKTVSVKTRQQMKIVLVSCLFAVVPFLIFNILPEMIIGRIIIPSGFSILFIGFIPLGMGYAVVTTKLMDIDIIIRRGVIYSLITLVMAGILSIAIFLVLTLEESLGVTEEILIALALGGIATLLFSVVRKGVESLIDRFFYRDRYDYRKIIQSLGISLNSSGDLTGVSRLVVGSTVHTLNLAGGCLFVKTQSNYFHIGATQGIFTDKNRQNALIALISQHNHKIEFPNKASSVYSGLAFLIPLVAVEQEVGFLCLSHKSSRQDFSSDDVFLLQGIASVAAMALRSAMLIHDVNLRDTFVSVASHELRTPLTSIVGYADLLLHRNPPDTTKKQWLKRILDNGQRLSVIVDDLLNVSRIQSGKVNIILEKVRLTDVLEEALSMAKEHADKHEFIFNIEPDLPIVLIDRDKFGQVVGNLLSNAVKYSPHGGRITLSVYNEPKKHQIIVSVTDEGIGISSENKDLLFTTFHRIQRPETQGIRGSGLGLYIAKEWTEAMGGKIWLESELNKGSTFFVAIPTLSSIATKGKSYIHPGHHD